MCHTVPKVQFFFCRNRLLALDPQGCRAYIWVLGPICRGTFGSTSGKLGGIKIWTWRAQTPGTCQWIMCVCVYKMGNMWKRVIAPAMLRLRRLGFRCNAFATWRAPSSPSPFSGERKQKWRWCKETSTESSGIRHSGVCMLSWVLKMRLNKGGRKLHVGNQQIQWGKKNQIGAIFFVKT